MVYGGKSQKGKDILTFMQCYVLGICESIVQVQQKYFSRVLILYSVQVYETKVQMLSKALERKYNINKRKDNIEYNSGYTTSQSKWNEN